MIKKNKKKYIKKIILIIVLIIISIFAKKDYDLRKIKQQRGFFYGEKDAPITIEEYSSFECGSCRDFHLDKGDIIKEYISNGVINYILRPVDIDRFEYDNYIYEHLSNEKIKDLNYIQYIFKTQDEWINLKSKVEINNFLMLTKKTNKYFSDGFAWEKAELSNEKVHIIPHVKINNEILDRKISKQELINKIEELKKENFKK